jgi:hypothetical protein
VSIPTLDGIPVKTVASDRITIRVLLCGPADGVPVLCLHSSSSCATWREETMLALPTGCVAGHGRKSR